MSAIAQKGIIRGSVIDNANGEVLIGVTIQVENTSLGTVTDLDGKFELKVEPGTYTLKVSYISYASITIESVLVASNEVTLFENIRMSEDVTQLGEVVVTAEAMKISEEALLTVKMKSANLLDGISSTNFKKMGDSDAAAAVKRVPGVSVEGGKYVFVRGLGDRYSKSTLNGVDIPGLDPDRNTVQMDLFPTSLIDNIVVMKSFTSDLPGDFTGGVVNIETKEFPEEKAFSVSASLGYNPSMHFNSNYLTYNGGKTDFLGFDDGTRNIPTGDRTELPSYGQVVGNVDSDEGRDFRNILENFNPTLAAMRKQSFMDYGLSFGLGNQFVRTKSTLGYNFSLSYSNTTEYFEDVEYARYGKGASSQYELNRREYQTGDYGVNNVSLSGLAGLALKRELSKYKLTILHTQNGESKAGIFDFVNSDLGAEFMAFQHNLEYSERGLTNIMLNGVHISDSKRWNINWKISPTLSRITDPDIRYTRYRDDGGVLSIGTESGVPERIWRFLEEDNLAGKVDITRDHQLLKAEAKLKFGASYLFKERNFEIRGFQIIPTGVPLTGDPNELFRPENLWGNDPNGIDGTRYAASFDTSNGNTNSNKFDSNSENIAFYVSDEFNVSEKFKAILGARMESYEQQYTGVNQDGVQLNDKEVLNDLDFFPSVNLIYSLAETQNLRFSFSKTIARPSFKEASYAQILDPITGRTFIGGFSEDIDPVDGVIWDGKLTSTRIQNFDLRWEAFQSGGQTISASVFYKSFERPIEIVQYVQAPNNFQPRNVGDGQVLGAELELRRNLSFISSRLKNLFFTSNITVTDSRIKMSSTEFNSRKNSARDGETIKNTRNMAGQAPYIINAGLSYKTEATGLETGLFYNVQGKTLTYVGIADKPDVYTVPFHSLNLSINKNVGKSDRVQVGINLTNMLGSERKLVFESYNAADQNFQRLKPGTSFSVKVGYKL
ncbi:MAG: TonB-dependent receptor [Flammeovirgaceae bacterium]|nr:TonB-dependent receptor [Flammeovirgaceae bacterium]